MLVVESVGNSFLSAEMFVAVCVTRVAQMAKKCRTYWDQCFSHLFYLVILENGQKVQKKCCLRVPNFKSRNGLIYIVISGQK